QGRASMPDTSLLVETPARCLFSSVEHQETKAQLRVAWFYDLEACHNATGVTRHALAQASELIKRRDIKLTVVSGRSKVFEARVLLDAWKPQRRCLLPIRTRDALRIWRVVHAPPIDWWTGAVDWVYCPAEYYVPTNRARLAVTSHDILQDLTFGG